MSEVGVYLYGFTRPGTELPADLVGVEGPGGVVLLPGRTASALCSPVELAGWQGEQAATNFQDTRWVVPRALQHERVLEAVFSRGPVLPVRFGALFLSIEGLHTYLRAHESTVGRFLAEIGTQREWSVKGYVDRETAIRRIARTDPDLGKQWESLPPTPGARYMREKQLLARARERLGPWVEATAAQVDEQLRERAPQRVLVPLRAPGADHPGADMLYHAALLLTPEGEEEFRVWLETVEAAFPETGLMLEQSGPWPPYHFCPSLDSSPVGEP